MNKQRRRALDDVHTAIMDAVDILEKAQAALEDIHDEEEEARDNMPESLWESEKYEQLDENVNAIEDAGFSLDDVKDTLDEILGNLWDIIHPEG